MIEGERVFTIRQTDFPPEPASNESPVVAIDLRTGAELWFRHLPFVSGDWTTFIAGVKNGKVYAARSGNGASSAAPLYCLDAADGHTLWTTTVEIDAGAYDGVIFADDGDPIIASFRTIWRVDSGDGHIVWSVPRTCSVSGNCGGCVSGGGVYVADTVAGGQVIKRFNLATGAFQYQGPVMPGFLTQTTPFAGEDGSVYFARIQTNDSVDFFYAFTDTGAALTQRWNLPARGTGTVGPDGSVYFWTRNGTIRRVNALDGSFISESPVIPADFAGPRYAVDAAGTVYFSNGAFSNGRLYSFTPALVENWSVAVQNINIGGPAIASDGTLVVCGIGADMRAYFTPPACDPDVNCDGSTNGFDIEATEQAVNGDFSNFCQASADLNGDGAENGFDIETEEQRVNGAPC
ncbi:hypothetical protein PHYC_00236 [Phycisphaerales bacterium]|nr:hypothetical protein PHYC_00236 [Phycisphaerales bacterium]